jgi:hypothetical protein
MGNVASRWVTKTAIALVALSVVFVLLRNVSSGAVAQVQYRVLESLPQDNAKLETLLNEFGQTGWELVLVDIGNVTKPAPRFIFKRVELP